MSPWIICMLLFYLPFVADCYILGFNIPDENKWPSERRMLTSWVLAAIQSILKEELSKNISNRVWQEVSERNKTSHLGHIGMLPRRVDIWSKPEFWQSKLNHFISKKALFIPPPVIPDVPPILLNGFSRGWNFNQSKEIAHYCCTLLRQVIGR